MKKMILLLAVVFSQFTFASNDDDKAQFCPDKENIYAQMVGPKNMYYYLGHNHEDKYFESAIYGGMEGHGPAGPLWLKKAEYDASTRTLTCTYAAYSIYGDPVLVNVGDY